MIFLVAAFVLLMWHLQCAEVKRELYVRIYQTADGYDVRVVDKDDKDIHCFYCRENATVFVNINGIGYSYCEKHRPAIEMH